MSAPRNRAFYNAWLRASKIPIYAWKSTTVVGRSMMLYPGPNDETCAMQDNGDVCLDGAGTKLNPFQMPIRGSSPHFGVFKMWFAIRTFQTKNGKVYIKVNDYLFAITHDGVVAEGGRHTTLSK